jgi:hypothetical protein
MKTWIALLLAMTWFFPFQVQVKPPPTLASLEIDLWPEYDKPQTLVIYRMTLDSATPLPADMSILIPTSVGDPAAVATHEANGLYNLAYTRTIQGDWSAISFKATSLQIQFEYYDPGLVKNGSVRSYSYAWQGDYAIKALTVQIQQPVDATQMQISPALGTAINGDGGLAYYNAMIGSVPAGTQFKISFGYQKANDTLSRSVQAVQTSETLSPNTPGRTPNPRNDLAYAFGGLGVLLLAGGGYWYFRTGQEAKAAGIPRRHKPRKGKIEADGLSEQGAIYCSQCGKRATLGDIFCRICGTRLRKE